MTPVCSAEYLATEYVFLNYYPNLIMTSNEMK